MIENEPRKYTTSTMLILIKSYIMIRRGYFLSILKTVIHDNRQLTPIRAVTSVPANRKAVPTTMKMLANMPKIVSS